MFDDEAIANKKNAQIKMMSCANAHKCIFIIRIYKISAHAIMLNAKITADKSHLFKDFSDKFVGLEMFVDFFQSIIRIQKIKFSLLIKNLFDFYFICLKSTEHVKSILQVAMECKVQISDFLSS